MDTTANSLECGHYLFAPLTGTKERSKELSVFQVRPAPTRFPTNILGFYTKCVLPVGLELLYNRLIPKFENCATQVGFSALGKGVQRTN